tara:strand:- start:171 stop:575 length:405 start_codon:yes stop_codon:yes gene_type:complete
MAALNNMIKDVIGNVFENKFLPSMEISQSATYKTVTTGTFNPSTGAITNSESDIAVKIIKKAFDAQPEGGTGGSDSSITETFLDFLVQPVTGVLPTQGHNDKIVLDSKDYNVLSVSSIDLGSDRLIYRIRAVGG